MKQHIVKGRTNLNDLILAGKAVAEFWRDCGGLACAALYADREISRWGGRLRCWLLTGSKKLTNSNFVVVGAESGWIFQYHFEF